MPTYEYECSHCKHRFELSQGMTDAPVEKCPECGHKTKRLIGSGSGIIFKGGGFYATDYRKSKPSKGDNSQSKTCPNPKGDCRSCQYS